MLYSVDADERVRMIEAGEDIVRRLRSQADDIERDVSALRGVVRHGGRRAALCAVAAAAAGILAWLALGIG